jgi:cytoskeletal protein CcmA (bactofilin family)
MFRSKKGSGQSSEPTQEPSVPQVAQDTILPKPAPSKSVTSPAKLTSGAGFPVDLPRRGATDLPGFASRTDVGASSAKDKVLVVGRDIHLKGHVSACERMIVEGQVELTVSGSRHIQIGSNGMFKGTVDVTEADIAGRFEGELIVRERLSVRSSGRIKGRIRYGHIVIEAGGEITGEVSALDAEQRKGGPVEPERPVGTGADAIPLANVGVSASDDTTTGVPVLEPSR